jgi:hypothetical protein
MFWKKKQVTAAQVVEGTAPAEQTAPEKKKKVKPLTPKEIMAKQIEQIEGTQTAEFRLPQDRGGWLVSVGLNPQYPTKGKKYVMIADRMTDGKPGKDKGVLWESNNAKDMAAWVIDRNGELVAN